MLVVVREEQTGLLLVADEAVDLLQIVAALHGDAHVGDCGKDLLVVFPGIAEHLLDRVFLEVQLDGDGVTVLEDLVALLLQQGGQRGGVRALGDGGVDVAVVVKDGQPGAHAIGDLLDVPGVDLVVVQFIDDVLAHAGVVHPDPRRLGRSSTLAMSSATFRLTPPCTCSMRPAFRPPGM